MAEEKKIVCMVTSYKKGTIAVSHAGVRSDWMEQDGPALAWHTIKYRCRKYTDTIAVS